MSYVKGDQLIGNDPIICPYCDKLTDKNKTMLSPKHLKIHGKTLKDVRNEYPNLITMTKLYIDGLKQKGLNQANQTKKVKCIYHNDDDCSKIIIEVPKTNANYYLCDKCKLAGKENKDGRTKKEANERRSNSLIKKFGVLNARHIDGATEKIQKTCETRYGGVGFASDKLAEKSNETIKSKYDVDNCMHIKKIAALVGSKVTKEVNPERAKKISDKLKGHTSKLKDRSYEDIHGKENCIKLINKKKQINIYKFIKYEFPLLLDYFKFSFCDIKYKGAHVFHNFKCNKCEKIINRQWNSIQQGYKCPVCYPRNNGTSIGETELFEYIKSILPNNIVLRNSRTIIPPKEIDIYIPDYNIAFEFNGLYWHSESSKYFSDKQYHVIKTNECLNKNIRLIHIFEDEWIFKKDIVKSRIKQILNCSNATRIHARKCEIKEIQSKEKNEFLYEFHIQGKDNSAIKLGAFYNYELISIMTFSKGNISKGSKAVEGVWELNRFCSDSKYHIPGIAGKLLKYFKRNYKWNEIFSYADRRWSQGNLYYKLGFELINEIPILNYWYVKNGKRIHRFNLRKRKDEPKNISENTLRLAEGYHRIWDCGNLKFKLVK